MFMGSKDAADAEWRRDGGGGILEAVRAKKTSAKLALTNGRPMTEAPYLVVAAGSMPCWFSTQVAHLSRRPSSPPDTYCAPRCSTQPGQMQENPHVHPVPAIEATELSGGIVGEMGGALVGERIGGSDRLLGFNLSCSAEEMKAAGLLRYT